MEYRDEIISCLANKACEAISGKVIQALTIMTEGMQSGDDSCLKNLWEEICVQVQGQESVFWDFYLEIIESFILKELSRLDTAAMRAIWLQTGQGIDWRYDNEDENGEQNVPIASEEIVNYVMDSFVLSAAADQTNRRIEKYLEREHD
jgi:hypothetical protein